MTSLVRMRAHLHAIFSQKRLAVLCTGCKDAKTKELLPLELLLHWLYQCL